MIKIGYYIIFSLLISCSNYGQLKFVTALPGKLDECSGIVPAGKDGIWVVEDHGNADNLYRVNFRGELVKNFEVTNVDNEDWEDLTVDESGNLYIADTGNNGLDRQEFNIYKLPDPSVEKGDKIPAETIKFRYPWDSTIKEGYTHDSEALFYADRHLYVLTKNRMQPFDGKTYIYKIPSTPGRYTAELVGSLQLCEDRRVCVVTAASLSPDGSKLVLLGYGKLWVLSDFTGDSFDEGAMDMIDLGASTQLESLCFKDGKTLLLADEERAGSGGNLYEFTLP
ncbi:NHL repeat-containing protein [Zeaxanthinibacter enoshimensis]|uniref:SdiA-regulated protein n=1 Tax=Zeaxanthinibacter enoshimensis TaxID=392009 RepID=A0A4R6TTJ9_9FLAO|nr:hypothetical protein [Zeaxanthinibacter enoshimensis]TDQ33249.1 hypothetical protein CLV82_1087 [Zeaxanthinibacter enoshimensis]